MTFGDFFDEPKFDFDAERKKFIDNLDYLKSMSVQEQTLYKKWQEFNADVYSMMDFTEHLFRYVAERTGDIQFEYAGNEINLSKPFKKKTMFIKYNFI